ncbi:MAG TPA: RimK/LysX family protein [Lacipirellulaceae bacterium]|jgi:hypothetical protein|nr:RimK/LysX family protein [Lacipirellulaceae bacterium]
MHVIFLAMDRLVDLANCRWMRQATLATLVCFCGAALASADEPAPRDDSAKAEKAKPAPPRVRLIGATTLVTEVTTGLPLPARVDTGATSCSIHCETFEIKDAHPDPKENIGKPVRFLLKNKDGEDLWIESKIVDHVTVRTAEREDERYKVRLQLRWEDVEKKVVATLNDRQKMKYPMLLGRNFLRDDFLVNVSLDAQE